MKMPVLFVGHGSPMNAIENNAFSSSWDRLGALLPQPKVILAVSAHWFTRGHFTSDVRHPRVIHDMYGFPEALYRFNYPAEGSPELAHRIIDLLKGKAHILNDWGLDHGTWSVLAHLFPKHDIPVVQLSVDAEATPEEAFALGEALRCLREEGVLILASGNIVHHLGLIAWDMEGGYPWADAFDAYIEQHILARDWPAVLAYRQAPGARQSVPTIDHFAPLLYALGASEATDTISVFNARRLMGSMSMTSYLFGGPDLLKGNL